MRPVDSFAIPPRGPAEMAVSTLPAAPSSQQDFAAVLGRHGVGVAITRQDQLERARTAAQEFVAVSLVQPVLDEARESSMAAEPFAPSAAEKHFRALQDASLAQRITRAAHFPLVDRLAQTLVRRGGETG